MQLFEMRCANLTIIQNISNGYQMTYMSRHSNWFRHSIMSLIDNLHYINCIHFIDTSVRRTPWGYVCLVSVNSSYISGYILQSYFLKNNQNSLASGLWDNHFRNIIFTLIIQNGRLGTRCEIVLSRMPQKLTDEKSTLVQLMAWWRQETRHYLSQCSVYCRAIALFDLMFFRWRNRLWIKFILHYFGPSWRSHWWIPQQMASNTQLWHFVADCLKSCWTNGTFANYSKTLTRRHYNDFYWSLQPPFSWLYWPVKPSMHPPMLP